MKTLFFVAASTLALAAAGCSPSPKPDLRTALDCPSSQGDLTRTNKAADGKTCIYTSSEGAEVTLQLIPVTGDATATLQGIENTIAPQEVATAETAKEAADTAKDAAEVAKDSVAEAKDAADAAKDAAKDAAQVAKEAAQDAGRTASATVSVGDKDDWNSEKKKDGVDVRIDGKKVVSAGEGETTRVDLPGIHISARDDNADVRVGGIRINADDDQSTIHIFRDVRLRGEALSREKRGIRATFIAANKVDGSVYRYVGYEAAGPKTGPITVAIVKAKSEISHDDDVARDVRRLVRRNGGA
ncbi:MAG: hypothetical protein ACREE0_15245 [Phenylobacterium sp.]